MNLRLGFALIALLIAPTAAAHIGIAAGGGDGLAAAGFVHPFLGSDHVLAMFALGLWGSQTSGRAAWVMPVTFAAAMALGGALGIAGVTLPAVEAGLAASVLALGLLVALAVRLPVVVALALTAGFAVLHGHAHGSELPALVAPIPYVCGFLVATALLLTAGATVGRLVGAQRVRVVGACIAFFGAALLAAS